MSKLKQTILLLLFFMATGSTVQAQFEVVHQQGFEMAVPCTPPSHPFPNGQCFPDWSSSHGSPEVRTNAQAFAGQSYAWMAVSFNDVICSSNPFIGEGIFLNHEFEKDHTYRLSYAIRATTPFAITGWYLTNAEFNIISNINAFNICEAHTIPPLDENIHQLWPNTQLSPATTWETIENLEFTPDETYQKLWIHISSPIPLFTGVFLDQVVIEKKITCDEVTTTAGFEVNQIIGDKINFSNTSISDERCPIVEWIWDFGDGSSCESQSCGPGATFNHTYENACGAYDVCLTVIDACGCDTTYCSTVELDSGCSPCQMLGENAEFYWAFNGGNRQILAFDVIPQEEFCLEGEQPMQITWDFGDGTSCVEGVDCPMFAGEFVQHRYQYCGTYNLCMEVLAVCGDDPHCEFEICQQVVIDRNCTPCDTLAQNTEIQVIQQGSAMLYQANIEPNRNCPITAVEWDFGNGTSCFEGSDCEETFFTGWFVYDYVECGSYPLSVTVYDECACIVTIDTIIEVNTDCEMVPPKRKASTPGQIKTEAQFSSQPNPFREQTTLRYYLEQEQHIQLSIMDVNGRLVKDLIVNQKQSAGFQEIIVDMRSFPQGFYYAVLKGEQLTQVIKLMKSDY